MINSPNGNFNKLQYLHTDKSIYLECNILESKVIDNGILSMMSARFKDDLDRTYLLNSEDITPLLKSPFTQVELSTLYNVGAMQFTENSASPFAFYSIIGNSKAYIVDTIQLMGEGQKKIQYLKFIDTVNEVQYLIDLFEDKTNAQNVNYLTILFQSATSLNNYSPYIHNYLNVPHSNTMDLVFLRNTLLSIYESELIDNLFDQQSQTKIGELLDPYEADPVSDGKVHGVLVNNNTVDLFVVNLDGLDYGRKYYR